MPSSSYYQEGGERAGRVQRLFTRIAPHYDLINDLQSLGLHRQWKKKLVNGLSLSTEKKVLDLASGSGDLVFQIEKSCPGIMVLGGDYTFSMLEVAKRRSHSGKNRWIQMDGLALPFGEGIFDAVTIAYGLRNFSDPLWGLKEMARVMKSGGQIGILEFGKPRNRMLRNFYMFFLRHVQPWLGKLFFQDADTYRYIEVSLQKYPAQEGVTRMLEEAGFEKIECEDLFFGTMSLHRAVKK